MAFFDNWFNRYPGTDFSQINLDWLIRQVRDLVAQGKILTEDFASLKTYVETELENLNVEERVRAVISEMISSGELDQVILDAIGNVDAQLETLENSAYRYQPSYIKTIQDFSIRPVICARNPLRGGISYVSVVSDDSYVSIGDLESDLITPSQAGTILLHHPNDMTFYAPANELLIADCTTTIKKVNAQTLTLAGEISVNIGGAVVIGVSYDDDSSTLTVTGELANDLKNIVVANIAYDGTVLKQFLLPIERFHGHAIQDGYIQGSEYINGSFCLVASSINGNRTPYGFSLITVDLENKRLLKNEYYNIEGEAESCVFYEDEVIVYGFSSLSNGSAFGTMAVFLTLIPRATVSADIYVDESRLLNGNGTSQEPFNNLSTALYNVQALDMSATIILTADVTKPLYIPQKHNTNIRIAGAYTIYMVNNITVNHGRWSFASVTLRRAANALYYWTFARFSTVNFENCTFRRDAYSYVLLVFNSSHAIISNCTINVTPQDTFGIAQSRYGSIVSIYCNTITMPASNPIINAVDGVVINTKTIAATYTNPFPTGDAGLKLGK